MFCGSQSHDFSCKHENHDLLTLASCYYENNMTEVERMDVISAILVIAIVGCFVAAVLSEHKK